MMSDPGSSMSLTAVLVLTVVVIVLLFGWLAVVFRAARQTEVRPPRPAPAPNREPTAEASAGSLDTPGYAQELLMLLVAESPISNRRARKSAPGRGRVRDVRARRAG